MVYDESINRYRYTDYDIENDDFDDVLTKLLEKRKERKCGRESDMGM